MYFYPPQALGSTAASSGFPDTTRILFDIQSPLSSDQTSSEAKTVTISFFAIPVLSNQISCLKSSSQPSFSPFELIFHVFSKAVEIS
jgi:hypothetical protein